MAPAMAGAETVTIERKYQMTRLGKGDYLLPSNDAQTLWRIYTYDEDGSAEWGNGKQIVGKFWACARYETPLKSIPPHEIGGAAMGGDDSLLDWTKWEVCATTLDKREDAIKEALRMSTPR